MERKYCKLFEFKQDFETGTFEGYGSTYGNVDLDDDIIEKGAFTDSVKQSPVIKLFYGHSYSDLNNLLGSAYVSEDNNGLYVKGCLDMEDDNAKKVHRMLKKGVLDSMSVGFRTKDFAYNEKGNRVIKNLELKEVSIVPFPANPQALINAVKSIREEIITITDFERFLRDSGFSRKEACLIASKGFKQSQSDSDNDSEIVKLIKENTELMRKVYNE